MATEMKGSDVSSSGHFTGPGSAGGDRSFADKGREKAKELTGLAKEKAVTQLDSVKGQVCSVLGDVAKGLERGGQETEAPAAKKLFQSAAQWVRQTNDRVCSASAQDLLEEVGDQLRGRPAVALAGLVGIGFLAGRIMKS